MSPYEILAGPLTLFVAPVGTAFPIVTAAPGSPWVKVGTNGDRNYAEDGVTVSHDQSFQKARPAGALGPVKAWRDSEDLMFQVTMWDMTLEQVQLALNANAVTTTAAGVGTPGTKKIGLSRGTDPAVYALIARGLSPYGDSYTAQYEVPRCYQSGNPKVVYKKGVPAGVAIEFTALEDPGAASPDNRFGRLVQQHAVAL